jgi:hypothetical protein
MLLVLLLGIADFGRVFTAGITLEAAARDGGEAAALERLRNPPTTPGDVAYYQHLHLLAAQTVCHETSGLPNSTRQASQTDPPATPFAADLCPDYTGTSGSFHAGMAVVRACVHDGGDPICGQPIPGYGPTVPNDASSGASFCPQVQDMADHPSNAAAGNTPSYWVEVRACYHFTTLFNLHVQLPLSAGLNLGDIWLERSRTFVVDCPRGDISAC